MQRNSTNNKSKTPMKKKTKNRLDTSDLLIENTLREINLNQSLGHVRHRPQLAITGQSAFPEVLGAQTIPP